MEVIDGIEAWIYGVLALGAGVTAYTFLPGLINFVCRAMAQVSIDEACDMREMLDSSPPEGKVLSILVSLLAGASCLLALSHYGFTASAALCTLLCLCLITASAIDLRHQFLPDLIVLPLLWVGLLSNLTGIFTSLESAVIGAAMGYAMLFVISRGFYLVTGRVGMGDGDLKLLAALGAWGGWQVLPLALVVACVIGLFFAMAYRFYSKESQGMIPFGPSLAAGGLVAILYGDMLSSMALG